MNKLQRDFLLMILPFNLKYKTCVIELSTVLKIMKQNK